MIRGKVGKVPVGGVLGCNHWAWLIAVRFHEFAEQVAEFRDVVVRTTTGVAGLLMYSTPPGGMPMRRTFSHALHHPNVQQHTQFPLSSRPACPS